MDAARENDVNNQQLHDLNTSAEYVLIYAQY
jgi:hypothetical protein